ncbi:helix-turn-helix domain-containing protein [Deminuibacter soli]|uniref:AraC family transcriptional regulator n=1 Tax=Deminuibacter soli TaxID=2291815 RepID=A0A3E1NM49_9BACT|nr:AraC family transcriptional regulator [Deminuibacter soli]RFM28904.1 AraC family transcriptional regulator [Deminuibacter soli]
MKLDEVFKIEYSHTDYDDLLEYYARVFQTRYRNGVLEMPPAYGQGVMRLLLLPNGLQCLISDYSVKQDMVFQRRKSSKNYYILRFDELSTDSGQASSLASKSAVCLTTTNFDWLFFETCGACIRSLNISFSEEWLMHFLQREPNADNILKYLAQKISAFSYEPMDTEYKQLLGEVLHPSCDEPFTLLHQYNRVMLLLELYFERLAKKSTAEISNQASRVAPEDAERLKEVEQLLLKDFSMPPGIAKLARVAAMSESKLKSCFKEQYGVSIYQYFQKHRMQKAKAMIVSRKYKLSQISMELGYENTSSFKKAFMKVFDQLPGEVVSETVSENENHS